MEEVILGCKACGAETVRQLRPEPKDAREAKQILFHCESCGAVNLRDGTLRTKRVLVKSDSGEEKDGDFLDGIVKTAAVMAAAVLAVLGFKAWKNSQGGQGQ